MSSKHLITFSMATLLTSAAALAHGVDVSKPDANTVCKLDQECAIRWSLKDVEEVKIQFRMSGTKEWTPLVETTKNSGEYKWKIAKNFSPGTYKVAVISTKDQEVHGVSPEFKIEPK